MAAAEPESGFKDVRHYVPRDLVDISFPPSVRGYDRHAVEAYVKRVNRVIAELKVSASPPAAVRHALDQAQEKVEALLQAARDAAEEITTSARQEAEESAARVKAEAAELMVNTSAEADHVRAEAEEVLAKARAEAEATIARAKSDAADIVAQANATAEERERQLHDELTALQERAQARMHEIQADTDAISNRRSQLLDDVHAMANALVELATAAAARVSPEGAEEKPEESEAAIVREGASS